MIKRSLCFFIILFSCLQAGAQSEFAKEWNVGVGFGPTFSSMSMVLNRGNYSVKTNTTTQYHGGVAIRYITEKNFGFIGELNFAQMGWEGRFEGDFSSFEYKRTLNYLEIPFLTHLYFGSDKARFFINLGPKLGFLVSDKETLNDDLQNWFNNNAGSENPERFEYYINKDPDKKIDYGLTAGMGMELRTKVGNFALEGRYYMGFNDIYKSGKQDVFSRSANREISAKLTYYIKLF